MLARLPGLAALGEFVIAEIDLQPKVTSFPLDQANEALIAVTRDSIDGAAVILT